MDIKDKEDLFVAAIEGGSQYWLGIETDGLRTKQEEDEPLSTYLFRAVQKGDTIRVYDCEDPDDRLGVINKKNIDSGSKLFRRQEPLLYADLITETWDATTADVWLQYCIMREVVFG